MHVHFLCVFQSQTSGEWSSEWKPEEKPHTSIQPSSVLRNLWKFFSGPAGPRPEPRDLRHHWDRQERSGETEEEGEEEKEEVKKGESDLSVRWYSNSLRIFFFSRFLIFFQFSLYPFVVSSEKQLLVQKVQKLKIYEKNDENGW